MMEKVGGKGKTNIQKIQNTVGMFGTSTKENNRQDFSFFSSLISLSTILYKKG